MLNIVSNNGKIVSTLWADDIQLSLCSISVTGTTAYITGWFTHEKHFRKGFGKQVLLASLKKLIEEHGIPTEMFYNWNGYHDYVRDFIVRHFNAKSTTSVNFQKYQAEADKSDNIYRLEISKVLAYIEQNEETHIT